ncbi:MAG: hypothetical protein KF794_03715 [Xanthobacteraceae bacterium]|nr:hypothetical protein [Xanthobacteraceae bacterium]QYK45811.1 MAG: hypothetical protein KF794_03715 [Xanthobacteraceae bacterium]
MKRFFSRGLAAAFFVLAATPAFAQTEVAIEGIYNVLQPYLLAVVSVIATAIVGWLAELLRRKFNLDIDASHRDALQTAPTNGAGLLLGKIGGAASGRKLDLKSVVLAEAVNYVLQAVPDAIRHFGITPESLAEKILAKLPQLQSADA